MKILVASDPESEHALLTALGIRSWSASDEFRIVSVVDSASTDYYLAEANSMPYLKLHELSAEYLQQAEKVADRLRSSFPNNKVTTTALIGAAPEQIAHAAREWQADLIVIGSHHKRGLTHLLEGSVSEGVVKSAECSVLIVPVTSLPAETKPKQRAAAVAQKEERK
jgi:nucleotide-binding universal stress UspA family protein